MMKEDHNLSHKTGNETDVWLLIQTFYRALSDNNLEIQRKIIKKLESIGKTAVDVLCLALMDKNLRDGAIKALESIGEPATDTLCFILMDKNPLIREGAAGVLGMIGDVKAVEPLIQILGDSDYRVNMKVVKALGSIGDVKAIDPLCQALSNNRWNVRRWAARALGEIGDTKAVVPLIKVMRDANPEVRSAAAEALGRIGDTLAVDPLIILLNDRDSRVVRYAIKALKAIGTPGINSVCLTLHNGEWNVRCSITEVLGGIGDTRAVNPLIQAINDINPRVRSAAIQALGSIGDVRAVDPIIQAINDDNPEVRCSAARALGMFRSKRTVEPLIQSLNDNDTRVAYYAFEALQTLRIPTGWYSPLKKSGAVISLCVALQNRELAVRCWAARALGNIGDARAVDPLIQTIYDSSPEVRTAATQALGNIGDKRAVEYLIQVIKEDNSPEVRATATQALGSIGDEIAVEFLNKVRKKDNNPGVRRAATQALGSIGDVRTVEFLHKVSETGINSRGIHNAAIDTPGSIGNGLEEKQFLQALKVKKKTTHGMASEALQKISDARTVKYVKDFFIGHEKQKNAPSHPINEKNGNFGMSDQSGLTEKPIHEYLCIANPESLENNNPDNETQNISNTQKKNTYIEDIHTPLRSFFPGEKQPFAQTSENIWGNSYEEIILGIPYGDDQQHNSSLHIGDVVRLMREPGNPHDPNAIRIETETGEKVGYIARDHAEQYCGYLDEIFPPVIARIKTIYWDSYSSHHIGFLIQFTLPDKRS